MILGNIVFTILVWTFFILVSLERFSDIMFSKTGLLLLLNSFIFSFVSLSIGFLISILVKGRNGVSAAANILGLGLSFISGAFVSQALLGESVLFAASLTLIIGISNQIMRFFLLLILQGITYILYLPICSY